jgi:hypothetical protein
VNDFVADLHRQQLMKQAKIGFCIQNDQTLERPLEIREMPASERKRPTHPQ